MNDFMAYVIEFLTGTNQLWLIVIAVILVLALILSIVKKAAKAIIVVLAIIFLIDISATSISSLAGKYGFKVEGNTITVNVNDNPVSVDLTYVESIEAIKNKKVHTIKAIDNNGNDFSIVVPNIVYGIAKPVIERAGIESIEMDIESTDE
jgi:hypothetical protein